MRATTGMRGASQSSQRQRSSAANFCLLVEKAAKARGCCRFIRAMKRQQPLRTRYNFALFSEPSPMSLPSLRLKANADRRLRAGHLWVYSNEIDVAATPLSGFAAGDQAILEAAGGKPLGVVALSPNNLICARLLSRDVKHVLDKSLLVHRINVALARRGRFFDTPCSRRVYGASALLRGLVVALFFDTRGVQGLSNRRSRR